MRTQSFLVALAASLFSGSLVYLAISYPDTKAIFMGLATLFALIVIIVAADGIATVIKELSE